MYKLSASNLQYVTSITSLITIFAKYMAASKQNFKCGNLLVTSSTLRILAKKQVTILFKMNFIACVNLWTPLRCLMFTLSSTTLILQILRNDIIGGLHIRRESIEDVLHGRLWYKLSKKNPPQRIILALIQNLSSIHSLPGGFSEILLYSKSEPQQANRSNCWRSRQERFLP